MRYQADINNMLFDVRDKGQFGYRFEFKCNSCGNRANHTRTVVTSRATMWEPADGYEACVECGSDDVDPTEHTPHIVKVIKRRGIRL